MLPDLLCRGSKARRDELYILARGGVLFFSLHLVQQQEGPTALATCSQLQHGGLTHSYATPTTHLTSSKFRRHLEMKDRRCCLMANNAMLGEGAEKL